MARGVRQGCPASEFLFAMAFDPIFRRLHDSIIPRNPAAPDFLQPSPCAYADDFADAVFVFLVFDDRLVCSLRGGGPGGCSQSQITGSAAGNSMATTAVMSCWTGYRQTVRSFAK